MTLRRLGPTLARFSHAGLVVMWLTGLAMVWQVYGGFARLPSFFWVKSAFVVTLTAAAFTTELTYAQIKRGNVKTAARLAITGPIAGASSLLAAIFAVLAFH